MSLSSPDKSAGEEMGGFRQWKYALDVLADRNVWMDTSSCMQEIDDDTLRAFQRRTRFTDSELDELLMNGSAMLFG